MEEIKSVTKIIDEVCEEMCDHFCKYTDESYKFMEQNEVYEKCDSCPLNKLR